MSCGNPTERLEAPSVLTLLLAEELMASRDERLETLETPRWGPPPQVYLLSCAPPARLRDLNLEIFLRYPKPSVENFTLFLENFHTVLPEIKGKTELVSNLFQEKPG